MVISTHWGSAGDGGTRRDQGVYRPPLEHGCTIHCDSPYYRLVSGRRAEAGDADFAEMVVAARSRYRRDKSGTCGRGGDEIHGYGGVVGR